MPIHVGRRLTERYERQARVLLSILTETPVEALASAPVEPREAVAAPSTGEGAVALGPVTIPSVDAASTEPPVAQTVTSDTAEDSVPAAHVAVAEAPADQTAAPDVAAVAHSAHVVATDAVAASNAFAAVPDASSTPAATGSSFHFNSLDLIACLGIASLSDGSAARRLTAARVSAESSSEAVSAARASSARRLPPNPGEPFMEPPAPKSRTARLVEETSSWSRVWRPFLYESIAWFIGAFLILSGTLYFVFESWDGMTSVTRSLTVFLMTVGYSAGFSVWGGYLARRDSLRKPGHILGLIGAAVAPLGGVALGPLGLGDALQLDGVSPLLLVPLLFVWAGAAAWLARKPVDFFDAPSRPFIQLGLVGATLIMGLAPLAARLGAPAVWLNTLPCILFFLLSSKAPSTPRKSRVLAFTLAAPLYLTALFAIRLHLGLSAAGTSVPPGTYAPFAAFLLATCLRFRTLEEKRAADPLAVITIALQVACLAGAIVGTKPAFFFTAAIFTGTLVSLSRGPVNRLPWLYPAYAGAYFSYATSAQLVPHALTLLINAIKTRMGYPPSAPLPFQYGALTALPFVLAGLVLAFFCQKRGERAGDARSLGIADVLLRATTWAAPAFALFGHLGPDSRPAFFATLALAVMSLGAGLLFKRFPLSAVGSVLFAVLPFSALRLFDMGTAAVVAGVLALGLAGIAWRLVDERTQRFVSAVVGVIATCGFAIALGTSSVVAAPVVGMTLGSTGVLLVAFRLRDERYLAYGAFLAGAILPKLAGAHSTQALVAAMVGGSLVLALLGERGGLLKRFGVPGLLYAGLAVVWGLSDKTFMGPVLVTAAATVAVASRGIPGVRPFAVVFVGLALLPDIPDLYTAWGLSPGLSVVLLITASLLGSVVAARKGRSGSTTVAGILALILPLVPLGLARSGDHSLFLMGAALAALFTARTLPVALGMVLATIEAAVAVHTAGPLALLGLAAFLSLLALLDDVPAVRRMASGGESFVSVSSLGAMTVLALSSYAWHGHALSQVHGAIPLALIGPALLPLVWTRALRQPFVAALMVLYGALTLTAWSPPPLWTALLPLFPLLVVRVVEHVPAVASLLLRSREEGPRHELSKGMQVAVACLGVLVLAFSEHWLSQRTALLCAIALVPMTGPLPSVRVIAASLLALFIPEARPWATGLLLALALAEHHAPQALATFFRGPRDQALRACATGSALGVAAISTLVSPTPGSLAVLGAVLLVAAFLLSQRWLLTAAVAAFALAPLGQTETLPVGMWRPEGALLVAAVGLAAALLSALCQSGAVQRALTNATARLTPGIEGTWSEPLWAGGAGTVALLVGVRLLEMGPGELTLPVALVAGAASLTLMVTRERWMMNVATALLGLVLVAAVPPLWAPAAVAGTGLLLAVAGFALDKRGVEVGAALHQGGALMALVSLGGLRSLTHPGMPLCVFFAWATAWVVVLRRRDREWVGWLASLFAVHAFLLHYAATHSTGRGAEFILPYFGAATALLATLVLSVAGKAVRGRMGRAFSLVALVEVLFAVLAVRLPGGASREAWVACGGLAVLLFALVRHAAREEDEAAAWLAQAAVAMGYFCVRFIGLDARPDAADSLVSILGGAAFTGLYLFVRREGAGRQAFRRPAIAGAWFFPLAGLLTVPWSQPFVAVALLVGYAAHFAALGALTQRKGLASLVSVAAFNTALYFVWLGTGSGEPQYYAIPAGLSLLLLLRVFRKSLSRDAYAQLRALAVTGIYVAGAWKPLLFNDGGAMLLCVFLCLVGVGAGIALRIRSYVYLGSAFLVTAVAANLVRFGMRDHRMGAAFLSLLGLAVVGFMVVLSAHRATLLQKYARVRDLLATWEG
ncbi:hypothetical protein [Corallococcus sp. EGB]|uniref:hypothetical protein n=1 Tax=Corallococcus sp. EGB TaxID=1521117 RepID=UPI001CBBF47F|nr:hypothetical protein [Corallococcus sp. EGB]